MIAALPPNPRRPRPASPAWSLILAAAWLAAFAPAPARALEPGSPSAQWELCGRGVFVGVASAPVAPAHRMSAAFDHPYSLRLYQREVELLLKPRDGGLSYMEELARRWREGDEHAETLLELGFSLRMNARSRQEFVPPADYREILERAELLNLASMRAGLLSEADLTSATLAFVPRRPGEPVLYVDPFRTPAPDRTAGDYWPEADEVTPEEWLEAQALGGMPFSLDSFITHDLAHLTERLRHPGLQRAIRRYSQARLLVPARPTGDAARDALLKAWETAEQRRYYTAAELFAFAEPRQAERIRATLPARYFEGDGGEGPVPTLARARAEADALGDDALLARIETILGHPEFLYRLGGGMRDGHNAELHLQPIDHSWYARTFVTAPDPGGRAATYPDRSFPVEVTGGSIDSLVGSFYRLRHFASLWRTDPGRPENRAVACAELARLELGLAMSVRLGITPERAFADLTAWKGFAATPTGRLLEAIAHPGSFYDQLRASPDYPLENPPLLSDGQP